MKKLLMAAAMLALFPAFPRPPMRANGKVPANSASAASRGNSKSENLNAKLNFSMEDDNLEGQLLRPALRKRGNVKVATVG